MNAKGRVVKLQLGVTAFDHGWEESDLQLQVQELGRRIKPLVASIDAFAKKFAALNGVNEDKAAAALNAAVWYECVHAFRWLSYSQTARGKGDSVELRQRYFDEVKAKMDRAAILVKELTQIDRFMPYFMSDALQRALEAHVSPDADLDIEYADPNTLTGRKRIRADREVRSFIESQMTFRISLSSDQFFADLLKCLLQNHNTTDQVANSAGPLRFEPPLSKKAVAQLDIAPLGLAARLAYRFREFSSGRYVHPYYPGICMPSDGRPNWGLVAELVNATFRCNPEVSEGSVRQRWTDLCKGRQVRLDPWPLAGIRQEERVYGPTCS